MARDSTRALKEDLALKTEHITHIENELCMLKVTEVYFRVLAMQLHGISLKKNSSFVNLSMDTVLCRKPLRLGKLETL